MPMIKSVSADLKIETLKDAKSPLFKQNQAIWNGLAKADLTSVINTPELIELSTKLQSVHIQYTVKVLAELKDAIENYNKVILIALSMFATNLIINFGRICYFAFDRYCSKEKRHSRALGEAQQQLDLYSELLPTGNVGVRLQQERPLAIE